MKNLFNSIKVTRPTKNVFDLSHDVKLSCNMGLLIPTMCIETIPGDRFTLGCESLIRFAPLVAPVMHRMDVTTHYYFVPNRILWEGWEKFITNNKGDAPFTDPIPAFPTLTVHSPNYTKLMDYMGIPTPLAAETETISALPFAAYQKIYNEYYRDQNIIPEVTEVDLIDGDNSGNIGALCQIRRRAWMHDYFTAALPFAQRGQPVTLPLGTFEDVQVFKTEEDNPGSSFATWPTVENNPPASTGEVTVAIQDPSAGAVPAELYAETSALSASSTTINDLRRAFKLQEWLEKAARAGGRYIENILIMFGVKSSDRRLQRPEYITGVKSPVVISEVLNTSDTATADQGQMAGHGISVASGKYGGYTCEEHGYIIGIMSILPVTAYQQGIPKHFLKTTDAFQYAWPSFANLGEQEVLNKEVYAFQGAVGGAGTFGYVPRYAEYKYENSRVASDFRTSLDFWHMGRIFSTTPTLSQEFIDCQPDLRIFAVEDANIDHLYCHVFHKVFVARSLPKYGTPAF